MRVWLAIVAGAVLLATALAIEAPASLLDQRIAALTAGHVRIAAATGSVWRGSGELTLLPDGARTPIAWRIDPLPLLRGGLAGSVTAGATSQPATFDIDDDRFGIEALALTLPAATALRTAGVPAAFAAAGGTLALDVAKLSRRSGRLEAAAKLRWHDASLPGPSPDTRIALGEVRLDAAGSGAQIPATLGNDGGEVELNGSVVFSGGGTPKLDALVRPRAGLDPERSAAIAAALAAIGRADGAGGYRVVWPLFGS